MFEKIFGLSKNGTTVRTELVAGLTTFMTMAYILAVNPNILAAAGIPKGGVFMATAVAAVVGTLLMAFLLIRAMMRARMTMNSWLTVRLIGQAKNTSANYIIWLRYWAKWAQINCQM